jgi:hypothetical protein
LVAPVAFLITSVRGPHTNNSFPTVFLLLHLDSLLQECVYWAVAQKWPWYIHLSCSHCIVMTLHTTILLGLLNCGMACNSAYNIWQDILKGREGGSGINGRIILKCILKK